MRKAVYIDAGHGGIDPGCPLGKTEKYYNLGVARELQKMLISQGFEAEMSRHGDQSVSLKERCQMANAYFQGHGGIFVSIHHNASPSSPAHGIETFYHHGSANGWKLAENIITGARVSLWEYDHNIRGSKEGNLYVLKHTKAPAVLVECEFLTHDQRRLWIEKHEQQWFRHMAKVIFDGIKLYYNNVTTQVSQVK